MYAPVEINFKRLFPLSVYALLGYPDLRKNDSGNVGKSRQRRSRPFAVLTYYEYAPLVKMAAALLDRPFGKTQGMLF